ncbi:DUF3616 domain-containing protein [Methylobacterium frigidaeris]|uniref:DUF3616 domain-containing protein n=1 Tax=Methylobacterium frigidaeris TaxID=2038277 RepID=A0AA37M6H1_9HYPH|nr:DUF3616 domain-containing protein [Methylobacterium frigidaeris]PIK69639.1 hypothetical protein CS379_28800 [Methylobacterium frigidaeris]GJD64570.1 hypothetical protein MPEAHAMD_4753 [Methylobacterium frigidaeris]
MTGRGSKRLGELVSVLALCLAAQGARAEVKTGPVLMHWGPCEASGAVPYPAGSFGDRFLVVDDEDNTLRLYRADESGPPLALKGGDLDAALATGTREEPAKTDLESLAWLGSDLVLMGSHARDAEGRTREASRQMLALTVGGDPKAPAVAPKGKAFPGLAKAIADLDPRLSERIAVDLATKANLSPRRRGFAIEGLSPTPDGRGLLIGLRNPLNADNDALVVPFENPAEVLAGGAAPKLAKPIALDLKGRGLREIAYAPGIKAYFLVAGGSGSGGEAPDLYRWSGKAGEAPARVAGVAEALAAIPDFQPEGLIVAPDGKRVQLISDDADICPARKPQAFRSVVLELE